MSLPYYKRYPRDFFEGTIGMPFEVKAAYSLVLDLIYKTDGNLKDDPRYISGMLGCSVRKWNQIRNALIEAGKLWLVDGTIHAQAVLDFRKSSKRESLPKWLRAFVLERDGYVCAYCGDTEGPFHVDHIFPVSRGGTDDPENLTCACASCNLSKSDKTLQEWRGVKCR